MTDILALALAQIDPHVGDIAGNLAKLRAARRDAAERRADVVIASEMAICGYPPEDLVCKPMFLDQVAEAVRALAADTSDGGPAVILGAPWRWPESLDTGHGDDRPGALPYNAVLYLDGGEIRSIRAKWDLPNYGVFDEKRVFAPGTLAGPMNVRGVRLGVMVCEDLWSPDVSECLEESGAEILVAINASPFEEGKQDERLQLALARIAETGLPLIYLNQVGGQDELVFDGASFAMDSARNLRIQLPAFEESLAVTHWTRGDAGDWSLADGTRVPPPEGLEAVYRALILGLRDYVNKNGFPGVVIGLSGGIDSALSAVVAADALGPERVRCVLMPSPYTSRESVEDSRELARLVGTHLETVRIEPAMDAFETMLRPIFGDLPGDITEENLQARTRGIALMALSNKFGPMVLSTGNKSEMAVGYATLYGDMCGGYSVLKDVYKTQVYRLARWRNERVPEGALGPAGRVVPENILTRAPTAELKPDQRDQDTLPAYEELDDILHCLIEEDMGLGEIAARGHDEEIVRKVWRMLEGAEYKRRQAPPGVKITRRSFGRDRRYPITNAFRG